MQKKRIVVCMDGTWVDADSNAVRDYPWWPFNTAEHLIAPSNVARICRSISREGKDKDTGESVAQIVYYHSGVGSQGGISSHVIGGATGRGISSNIRDAYSFICTNYEEGNEIFLFGFSRGAFTARSISSLIKTIGILNEEGLVHFYPIFKDWENQGESKWPTTTPLPDDPWGSRARPRKPISDPTYIAMLQEKNFLRTPNVKIKCCGVWDTVGSLGIPMVWFLPQPVSRHYSFVDTNVESNIEYAFQALALDERRRPFTPTIWAQSNTGDWPQVLKQCWFRGVHSDVGGGSYTDQELANITLTWMISQLETYGLLSIERSSYWAQVKLSAKAQYIASLSNKAKKPETNIEAGEVHKSLTWIYRIATGWRWRRPLSYRETGKKWYQRWLFVWLYTLLGGKRPNLLEHTNETVHRSVRQRGDGGGKALSAWTLASKSDSQSGPWQWVQKGRADAPPLTEDAVTKPQDARLDSLEDKLRDDWPGIVAAARSEYDESRAK